MTRRVLLISLLAATASGENAADILQVFEPLATALSSGDAEAFLRPIDRRMPGYGQLRENIYALVAQFDVTSSIEFNRVQDGQVELDWELALRAKAETGVSGTRRQTVTARIEKKRILSIAPIDFFAPKAS
jgi:1-aminocyclopropane-1-carboxylate deaminase/D-cysteine desulfhydrase-like pyridoxal-dependent ACC family enzyme